MYLVHRDSCLLHTLSELLLYYSAGLVQRGLEYFGLSAVDKLLQLGFRFATSLCCDVICGARISRFYSLHSSMNSLSGRSSIRSGRNGIHSGRNGISVGGNGIDRSSRCSGISSGSNAIANGSSGISGSFIDRIRTYDSNRLIH